MTRLITDPPLPVLRLLSIRLTSQYLGCARPDTAIGEIRERDLFEPVIMWLRKPVFGKTDYVSSFNMTNHFVKTCQAGTLVLTLNRPEKRNALTREMVNGLRGELDRAMTDESVTSVVITGAGSAFCAGMDLNFLSQAKHDPELVHEFMSQLYDLYENILQAEKPVIAAVNGPAVAGGAGLAIVCDMIIAAESAVIGYPEIKKGLVAGVVIPFLVRCVGEKRAKHILLTGDLLSSKTAMNIGLFDECVPGEQCLSRALERAATLGGYPSTAYKHTKRMLNKSLRDGSNEKTGKNLEFSIDGSSDHLF